LSFTSDVYEFKTFLSSIEATGGGDECEDIAGCLVKATEFDWKN